MVTDSGVEKSLGNQIYGVGIGIDDRGSDNAFLIKTGSGAAGEIGAAGGGATVEHAGVPELGAVVGVNGVNRIRLGDNVNDVVYALARYVHAGHVEGLGHRDIVDGRAEELTEAVFADVGGGEQSFIGIGSAASVITPVGQKGLLRERGRQQRNANDEQSHGKIAGGRQIGR